MIPRDFRPSAELPVPNGYTDFQLIVHALPEGWNRFLGGGRGGSKSFFLAQDIGVRAERHEENARILYIRQGPWLSFSDFIETTHDVFDQMWGRKKHRLNLSTHIWHNPTGAHIQLGILPDGELGRKYYEKAYQGNSLTDLLIDEAQQFARADVLDLLMSNMRGPIPTRVTIAANPGGIGHQVLAKRYVFNGHGDWTPFEITIEYKERGVIKKSTKTWIYCPSTYLDNPYNGDDYLANLASACGNDEELLQAWITGSWKISRGAFFASVLDNPYVEIDWPTPDKWKKWIPYNWRFWLAHDFGSAAPSATYVMAKSPGSEGPDGLYYPAGSILLLDEFASYRENDYGKGYGWTTDRLAKPIKQLAARWRIKPRGVADDQVFGKMGSKHGTIADEFKKEGVTWVPARKGLRPPRHVRLKNLLAGAGSMEKQGMYVATRCKYWWATVPFLIHDSVNVEDVKKCDTDHGLDASEYGLDGDVRLSSMMNAPTN